MRTFNQQIATAAPLNANYQSQYVPLRNIIMYCIVANITGVPTGTLTLEASNDPETNDTQVNASGRAPAVGPTNWVTIKDSDFTVTTAGKTMWNVEVAAYNYVRVAYVDASGGASTATMSIVFNGKGL